MKKSGLSERVFFYVINAIRYALYAFNLLLLFFLGIKTVKTWLSLPFTFSETLKKYPNESEFSVISSAQSQFWGGLIFETSVFVIGSFLCYELFIKHKIIQKNLLAPFFIAFLMLFAESFSFFLPALDKVREINVCEQMNLSWDEKNHRCDYMELEKRRLLMARRKNKKKK